MENISENKFAPVHRRYRLNTYSCLLLTTWPTRNKRERFVAHFICVVYSLKVIVARLWSVSVVFPGHCQDSLLVKRRNDNHSPGNTKLLFLCEPTMSSLSF